MGRMVGCIGVKAMLAESLSGSEVRLGILVYPVDPLAILAQARQHSFGKKTLLSHPPLVFALGGRRQA